MIRISEELLVFLLNKQNGYLAPVPEQNLHYALAGAVLMDLSIEGRIDTDIECLVMVDPTPLGDDILDPILGMIVNDTGKHDAAHWVKRLGMPEIAGRIQDRAISRLIKRRILEQDLSGFLSLTQLVRRARRYPKVDGKEGQEVDTRIMGILFADDVPYPRDAMLIAVVDACGIFDRILSPEERADVADRIDLLRRLDLIGRTVSEAISRLRVADRADAPVAGRIIISAEQRTKALARIPMVTGGLPILGHAIGLATDPMMFLTKQYRALGPVFRVRVPGGAITVLAGQQANAFLQRDSRLCLRSFKAMGPLVQRLGAHRALLNMDGAEHVRMRKTISKSFSPKIVIKHLGSIADIAASEVSGWPEGQPITVLPALQRIVAEQTSQACSGTTALESIDDVAYYMDKVIACFSRRAPKWSLRLPRARRARAAVCKLAEGMLNAHDPALRSGMPMDFVDNLIKLHHDDPQFLPQNELRYTSLSPFLVGLHTTTATVAFMLYEVLKHPEVYAAMQSEADALFGGGGGNGCQAARNGCDTPGPDGDAAPVSRGRVGAERCRKHL